MATKASARSKGPTAKAAPKKGRVAVGARSKNGEKKTTRKSSDKSKRATPTRRGKEKPLNPPASKEPEAPAIPAAPRGRGRPKDTPDVWTPAHIEEVASQFWDYIEATPCPSLAEFCFKSLVRRQRIYEIPELLELKEFLYAKRAAALEAKGFSLTREDGPRGAFICKAISNVGDFSMVEKTENVSRVQATHVYLPDNGRGDGPKPEGEHA
jgi:hypothetical protein